MKRLLIFLLCLASFTGYSQSLSRTFIGSPSGMEYNTRIGGYSVTKWLKVPRILTTLPASDSAGGGQIAFDSANTRTMWYHNGTQWVQFGSGGGGSGTVTSITAGYGLNGGTITTSGTVSADTTKLATIRKLDSVANEIPTVNDYVPYTGATANVDLGAYNLKTDTITGFGAAGLHLHGDASNSGIEISGFGYVRMDAYPIANTGDSVLSTNSNGFIQRYDLKGKLSNYALQTALNDTAAAIRGAIPSVTGYVPYSGATTNLNMGNFGVTAKRVNTDTLEPNSSAGLHLHNTSHQDIFIAGAGGGQNLTVYAPTSYVLMANQSETDTVLGSNSTGLLKKIGIGTTYLKKEDTASLSARINTKQNYSDTTTWDATRSWVTSQIPSLTGYQLYSDTSTFDATRSWVTSQGYATTADLADSMGVVRDSLAAIRGAIPSATDTTALSRRIELLNTRQGANIASADTINLLTTTGNYVNVTGTTTIRGLSPAASGNALLIGARRVVQFTGALTLTYNATTLILPGSASITTVAGDMAEFVYEGGVAWRCINYTKRTWTGTGSVMLAASPSTTGTLTAAAITASGTISMTGGTVTLGSSTGASTVGLGTGATTTGNTKTINIGGAAASGSTQNINIGSTAVSGSTQAIVIGTATSTTTLNGTVAVANVSTVSGTVVSNTGIQTLTNKRITYRTSTAASYTTSVTIPADSVDIFNITAQAGALLFNAPSGTPTDGQILEVVIKDNGTARALTWNAIFDWSPPSTTVLGKWMKIFFQYNATAVKWNFMRKVDEP